MSNGVVRVDGGGSLLRGTLVYVRQRGRMFADGPYTSLDDWSIDVIGGLPDLVGRYVPIAFLMRDNVGVFRGEAVVQAVEREPHAPVNRPLRWIWSSRLLGNGPLRLTLAAAQQRERSEPS